MSEFMDRVVQQMLMITAHTVEEEDAMLTAALLGLAALRQHREVDPAAYKAAIRAVIGQTAIMGKRLNLPENEMAVELLAALDAE